MQKIFFGADFKKGGGYRNNAAKGSYFEIIEEIKIIEMIEVIEVIEIILDGWMNVKRCSVM